MFFSQAHTDMCFEDAMSYNDMMEATNRFAVERTRTGYAVILYQNLNDPSISLVSKEKVMSLVEKVLDSGRYVSFDSE